MLTADLVGAQAVAELFFPDELVMDVPPNCTDLLMRIDCQGTTEIPASEQLSIASERNVVEVSPNNYDVTITSDISTLNPVLVSWNNVECATALTSAFGETPVWTMTMDLTFDTDPGSGDPRVTYSSPEVTGVEIEDWGITSWGEIVQLCGQGHFSSDFVNDVYTLILDTYMGELGNPLCAVTGPDYLGPCS